MTYLEVVNNVLRRMREDEVSDVDDTVYSKMVGDYVNDAKTLIEGAWDWSYLRSDILIPTVAGVSSYEIPGSDYTAQVKSVTIEGRDVNYLPLKLLQKKRVTPISGPVQYYSFTNDGVISLEVFPTPISVQTLRVESVLHSSDLIDFNNQIRVPALPLIHMTIALLSRERGETGGPSAAELYAIADRYVSDAIALDARRSPEDLLWRYI